ncbi:MAG: hypothetical protein AB2421_11695 [Thermotaleaceae bacterium]
MRFYVLAKCIDTEQGNIVIDFEKNCIEKLDLKEILEEDHTYIYANGEVIRLKNVDWSIRDTYLTAFQKIRKLNASEYRFVRLNKQDDMVIDQNYFIYQKGNLLGRLVNKNEINIIEREGMEKTQRIINKYLEEGISILIRGKKIYRIFTLAKLKTVLGEGDKQISIQQYMSREDKLDDLHILLNIEKNVQEAYEKLGMVMRVIKKKNHK